MSVINCNMKGVIIMDTVLTDDYFSANEQCWEIGNYTDECNCGTCPHADECGGSSDNE